MIKPISMTVEQITKNFITKSYKPCELPTKNRPYALFDNEKVDSFVKNKELAIPKLIRLIDNAKTEAEKTECIYIADQMVDAGTKKMSALFPKFSKFNEDKSPNVQTFLAGFYRKTLNPDGFAPLVKIMMDNIKNPHKHASFDPNEEVGGAVLEYMRDAFKKNLVENK